MIVKALIADDSPIVRKIVRTNLEKLNVKLIKETKNGEETLASLKYDSINLLFLDLNMPEPTGWEILDQLYKSGKTSEIYVVVISSEITEETRKGLKSNGAVDFIPKPFNIQVFHDVVSPIIEKIHNEEKHERLFETQRIQELLELFGAETPTISTGEGYLCFEFKNHVVKVENSELSRVAILEHKIS